MSIIDEIEADNPALKHTTPSQHAMMDLLDGARNAVLQDRNRDYGPPEENPACTAKMWSAYIGFDITARQVCDMNILQKISRLAHRKKLDSYLDIAGFAANAAACMAVEPKEPTFNHRGY